MAWEFNPATLSKNNLEKTDNENEKGNNFEAKSDPTNMFLKHKERRSTRLLQSRKLGLDCMFWGKWIKSSTSATNTCNKMVSPL